MKPLFVWAVLQKGELTSISWLAESREEALHYINRPAGDRVVPVKIVEVKPKHKARRRS